MPLLRRFTVIALALLLLAVGLAAVYRDDGHLWIVGSKKNERLTGSSRANDWLIAGRGNDVLFARDKKRDYLNCGPGFDIAVLDRIDRRAGCEVRRFPPKPPLISPQPVAPVQMPPVVPAGPPKSVTPLQLVFAGRNTIPPDPPPDPPLGFLLGVVSNADHDNAINYHSGVANWIRLEYSNSDSAASIESEVDDAIAAGMLPVIQAADPWTNLSNLVAWCDAFGDKILAIEFGNEDNFEYKGTTGDGDIYGDNYNTVHAGLAGRCPLWAQGGDPHFGSGWTADVRAQGGAANTPDAWITHPYGPPSSMGLGNRSKNMLDDVMSKTTGDVWITEWGITTDNGPTLAPQTYDWPANYTYAQAATGFQNYMDWVIPLYPRLKGMAYYQSHDQVASGSDTESEHFFGLRKQGGVAKSTLTAKFAELCAIYDGT
jgi:hypothetical protein